MEIFRKLSIFTFCVMLVSCAGETSTPPPVSVIPAQPDAPPTGGDATTETKPADPIFELLVIEDIVPLPNAWEQIESAQNDEVYKSAYLLDAAATLVADRRYHEALEILELMNAGQLNDLQSLDLIILKARLAQVDGRHRTALRALARLQRGGLLNLVQSIRVARLKAYSYSIQERSVSLANELVRLYSLLSDERVLQIETGHELWATLSQMTTDELRDALEQQQDPIARQWFVLALALGLDSVRADPYKYSLALNNWRQENAEHPANRLIEAGLANDSSSVSKIALLLPQSSVNHAQVNAFLDGFLAQYEADTNPLKPEVEVIDIGSQPSDATRFYYQAVDSGADFVIGPLGVDYVNEVANYADFIVPTLLLGEVPETNLPDYVFQFALALEHEGFAIAERAWQDGHVTALVIKSPQQWSERIYSAFSETWQQSNGHVIQVTDYELNQKEYSEAAKNVLLIDSSASRYQVIRELVGEPMKFVPRRRQDADFIVLIADSKHGRLLKPYLDFLKAHDLPIYSTSYVFPGEVNKIRDQDLNGVQFSDMNWILDRSDHMSELRSKLEDGQSESQKFVRLFAMGVDIYRLIPRINTLSFDQSARFHGITSVIRLTEDGRILRSPRWAVISDGLPELIPGMAHPELGSIRKLKAGPLQIANDEKPE